MDYHGYEIEGICSWYFFFFFFFNHILKEYIATKPQVRTFWQKEMIWWFIIVSYCKLYIDGLVQYCSNSSAFAMELLQSCTKPSIYCSKNCSVHEFSFSILNFSIHRFKHWNNLWWLIESHSDHVINSSWTSDAICRHWYGSTLVNSLWPSDATEIMVTIDSGNGALPDRTKPLPEPMLTYHQ